MKLEAIKQELEFIKTVLPKKETFDTQYNLNYIKIEPEKNKMYLIATDGFRMSLIEMPNLFDLTEPIFIHKNEPVDTGIDSKIEKDIPYPDAVTIYKSYIDLKPEAIFKLSDSIIDLLKSFRYRSEHYKNPIVKFEFNTEGIFITELKLNEFVFNSHIPVIKSPHYFEDYLETLIKPFSFSINTQFMLQTLEKYYKYYPLHECRATSKILIVKAEGYKKVLCDIVMGIIA